MMIDGCRGRSSSLEPNSKELIPARSGTDKWRRAANEVLLALAVTSALAAHINDLDMIHNT
jgi:hypothetical protein